MNSKQTILPSERLERLAQQVAANGSLSVGRLAEIFHVSEATIRRDLYKLSCDGVVKRIRGWGVGPGEEPVYGALL